MLLVESPAAIELDPSSEKFTLNASAISVTDEVEVCNEIRLFIRFSAP